ncbi:MAG: hypothetical protein KF851_16515 [Pirellulaceae bacterium]|nr:hypothetical protein [Pirellulaceae bacterium]
MSHAISNEKIEELAYVRGIHDFNDWQCQTENQLSRIERLLDQSIQIAWANCLPIWLEFGRVRDLSLSIRVPKYWPSFARNLGIAFAERYEDKCEFLIERLQEFPVNSHEFLCALDLLEFIVTHSCSINPRIFDQLFELDLPLSPVVVLEIKSDHRYTGLSTVGQFLKRRHAFENGDAD